MKTQQTDDARDNSADVRHGGFNDLLAEVKATTEKKAKA